MALRRSLILILLAPLLIGATKYKPILTSLDDMDSLRVHWRIDSGTRKDSALYTGTSVFDSVAISDTADYVFEYRWYADGALTHASIEQFTFKKNIPIVARDTLEGGGPIDTMGHFSYGGSGARAITLVAYDTGASAAVANVELTVRNSSGTLVGWRHTNSVGSAAFTLDDATYTVTASLQGYGFNALSLVVTAAVTDTLTGAAWSTTQPSSASLCRVQGHARDASGVAIQGIRVTAKLNGQNIVDTAGVIISPEAVGGGVSDTNGYWYIDLLRTAAFDDATEGRYDVEGWSASTRVFHVKDLRIPSDTIFNLADTIKGR